MRPRSQRRADLKIDTEMRPSLLSLSPLYDFESDTEDDDERCSVLLLLPTEEESKSQEQEIAEDTSVCSDAVVASARPELGFQPATNSPLCATINSEPSTAAAQEATSYESPVARAQSAMAILSPGSPKRIVPASQNFMSKEIEVASTLIGAAAVHNGVDSAKAGVDERIVEDKLSDNDEEQTEETEEESFSYKRRRTSDLAVETTSTMSDEEDITDEHLSGVSTSLLWIEWGEEDVADEPRLKEASYGQGHPQSLWKERKLRKRQRSESSQLESLMSTDERITEDGNDEEMWMERDDSDCNTAKPVFKYQNLNRGASEGYKKAKEDSYVDQEISETRKGPSERSAKGLDLSRDESTAFLIFAAQHVNEPAQTKKVIEEAGDTLHHAWKQLTPRRKEVYFGISQTIWAK